MRRAASGAASVPSHRGAMHVPQLQHQPACLELWGDDNGGLNLQSSNSRSLGAGFKCVAHGALGLGGAPRGASAVPPPAHLNVSFHNPLEACRLGGQQVA